MTLSDWGSLGSAVGGIATAILVLVGFVVGLPGIRDWRAKLRAQRDREDEQTKQIRIDRRRAYRRVVTWTGQQLEGRSRH